MTSGLSNHSDLMRAVTFQVARSRCKNKRRGAGGGCGIRFRKSAQTAEISCVINPIIRLLFCAIYVFMSGDAPIMPAPGWKAHRAESSTSLSTGDGNIVPRCQSKLSCSSGLITMISIIRLTGRHHVTVACGQWRSILHGLLRAGRSRGRITKITIGRTG